MKIAIVILNWNGKHLLERFLPSVVAHASGNDVYVADNASNDNSVDFVKTHFPNVKIIQHKDNFGYAKGYNQALISIDADVFCLMNSDVEVTENWLPPIVQTFEEYPDTAIIQPKLLDFNHKDHFEYAGAAGGFLDRYGYPYCRGRIFDTLEKDQGQYDDVAKIFWASGACLFIKKNIFDELGGLDEAFFAHFEEIDLCWRAHNLGYETRYVGNSCIYHVGGATLKNTNPRKTYLNFRNSLYAITKNAYGNWWLLVFLRLVLDGAAALKFLFELKPSHFFAIIKAHFAYYSHLTKLLRQRKFSCQKAGYYQIQSIVWAYFVKKKQQFDRL
ncbi:MAG TPA: glycosyltransferase family 2 protein [Aquaticitalea sp.]|nr:glycosyltransferase family 2 protein [Aquaticitalea sp.]HNU58792.1 glycosyltransferase family 2 protein [Aquaticitalea sp.]